MLDKLDSFKSCIIAVKNSMLFKFLTIFSLLFFLTSCQQHYLNIQTHYLSQENLASTWVNTPDPEKYRCLKGQRLMVEWFLPKDCKYHYVFLHIKVRFKNHQEEEVHLHINKRWGTYLFTLDEEKFLSTKGIATYDIKLFKENDLISHWQHPLWIKLITFEK